MRAAPYSKYEEKYLHKSRSPSSMIVVRFWMAFMAIVAGIFFIIFITNYLNQSSRQGDDGRLKSETPHASAVVHTKLVFVTAWIDLGAEHTEKTPKARLEYFKRLAESGISLFVFVSPSNIAALGEAQTEFPNIVGLRSIQMEDL
jgi:hypothetical protein